MLNGYLKNFLVSSVPPNEPWHSTLKQAVKDSFQIISYLLAIKSQVSIGMVANKSRSR
jgi:hypothetical protein